MLTTESINEVSLRVKRALTGSPSSSPYFCDLSVPAHIAQLAQRVLANEGREVVLVFLLDRAQRLVAFTQAVCGSMDMSVVTAREVFRAAIVHGVGSIVLCHNHPNGSVLPSAEDFNTTNALRNAGEIIGIPIFDHVIITPDSSEYYSFREMGFF